MKKQLSIMIALAVLAIGIITSCKKDPIPNNNEQNNEQPSDTIPSGNDTIPNGNDTIPIGNDTIPIGNDTIPNGNDTIPVVIDGIRFGDTTGMKVTTYNTIMEFDDAWNPILLDLNNDGTNDIRIETYYDGPLAIGQFQELTLHCLSSIKIHGESIEKESYSHRDTIYTPPTYWNDLYSTVVTYVYIYSQCEKIADDDIVQLSSVFEVMANDYNDILSVDDSFHTENVILYNEDIDYGTIPIHETADTLFLSQQNYIYHCWNFPTDEEKYIGFKITINDKPRLGWLKIKLHPTWGGKVVDTELIETAIQK